MSMNLGMVNKAVREGYNSVNLFQTPTNVTYELLGKSENGEPEGGHLAVRDRYLAWLEKDFLLDREPGSDAAWARELFEQHRAMIMAVEDPYFFVE